MAVQETTKAAALAIHACSPDTVRDSLYTSVTKISEGDDEYGVAVNDKKHRNNSASQLKNNDEIILNRPIKITNIKHEQPHAKMTEIINTDIADDLADIYISDEVLKQLRSQTEEKGKRTSIKTRRRLAKSQRKITKTSLNNREETDTNNKGEAKKILKPSLHRKSSLSVSKSQFIEHADPKKFIIGSKDNMGNKECSMECIVCSQENIGNKAENNNWMVDDEKSGDMQSNAVVQSFYSNVNTSYMDTIIKSSESLCRVCSLTKCTEINCKGVKSVVEPVINKEYSFKGADSSDDSGCFSNVSVPRVNSPGPEKRETDYDGYINSGRPVDESNVSKENTTNSVGLCSACGNEPQGHGSGLCKTCIGRIKHDGIRIGALGELRAYAQSIADSVKKILSISPRESQEALADPTSPGSDCKQVILKGASSSLANAPVTQLQKCKTQISMTHASEDTRSKSLLNKSMSFDGRVATHLEETSKRSPMYWISQEKSKLPISSSTLSDEDKLRKALEITSSHSFIDGDYFSSSVKGIKNYLCQDNDATNKLEQAEKLKRKSYTKQRSCIERVKTEEDTRENYVQQSVLEPKNVQEEHKAMYELQRGKSRITRMSKAETKNSKRNSQKHEEEIKALNVFRLKVIHEGSPVDPLYTVQRGRGEDGKDRRVSLMRSATAPNKNQMPKKDMADEKSVMKGAMKPKRVSTNIQMKANKSPMYLQEENTFNNVLTTQQTVYDCQPESWRDDSSVMAVVPFTRRRSTSYDDSKSMSSKRNGSRRRSISRSTVNRDDKSNTQRRHIPSSDKTSIQSNTDTESVYSVKTTQPMQFSNRSAEKTRKDGSVPAHSLFRGDSLPVRSTIRGDTFTDNYRYQELEAPNKEFLYNEVNDMSVVASEDELIDMLEPPNKSSYFNDKYYNQQTEDVFPPNSQALRFSTRNVPAISTASYYCQIDEPEISSQIVSKQVLKFDSVDVNYVITGAGEDDEYHNRAPMYELIENTSGNDSLWYSSHAGGSAFTGRELSHESKSSTSFHLMTTAKSSHSDVSLMKQQVSWDHTSSRRQSMYSETDVDTGLIYHFAKRQTTRAHVPAFLDLTSSSKDIYTMSGDVSTPASSNSAISTKSEVSDSVYTGGFFKHDPFYDNDNTAISSSSSAESSCQLYFEPSSETKREPSELDIYTGALFSSSQNAISLGATTEGNLTNSLPDAHKDGSTNNSTRPPVSRMSRRLRYRPHIDVIKFKTTDSSSKFFSKHMEPNNEILLANISNNSSNFSDIEDNEDYVYQGAVVKRSKDSSFVSHNSGMNSVFNIQKVESTAPFSDYRKYEYEESESPSYVFAAPLEESSSQDKLWYNGFSKHTRDKSMLKHMATPDVSDENNTYSWQNNDDYYKSAQRPRINKSNNCTLAQPNLETSNTNNNHFEDIYTGFFEAPTTKTSPAEQSYSCKKIPEQHWYADQPRGSYSSMDFFDEDNPKNEPLRKPTPADYESKDGAYSSASVFGQASAAYSGSRTYMAQSGWKDYDNDMSSSNSYDGESPNFAQSSPETTSLGEMYSYFNYASNQSQVEGSYPYDKDTYSFDQRDPSPESIINEIRKVGGIVCRENVVNKEDYAEDVNRDLEQGAWMPFTFRHDEKPRHVEETNNSRSDNIADLYKASSMSSNEKNSFKHLEDSNYNQDRIYDNDGARNKWREMTTTKGVLTGVKHREPSPYKSHLGGDSKAYQVGDARTHSAGDTKSYLALDTKTHSFGDTKTHSFGDAKTHSFGDTKTHSFGDAKTHSSGDTKRPEFVKTGAWNPPDQIPDRARGKRNIPSTPKSIVAEGPKESSATSNLRCYKNKIDIHKVVLYRIVRLTKKQYAEVPTYECLNYRKSSSS